MQLRDTGVQVKTGHLAENLGAAIEGSLVQFDLSPDLLAAQVPFVAKLVKPLELVFEQARHSKDAAGEVGQGRVRIGYRGDVVVGNLTKDLTLGGLAQCLWCLAAVLATDKATAHRVVAAG